MDNRSPALCLASSNKYFGAFRTERLPANLIQGQRDFFGVIHISESIKKERSTRRIGISDWSASVPLPRLKRIFMPLPNIFTKDVTAQMIGRINKLYTGVRATMGQDGCC